MQVTAFDEYERRAWSGRADAFGGASRSYVPIRLRSCSMLRRWERGRGFSTSGPGRERWPRPPASVAQR